MDASTWLLDVSGALPILVKNKIQFLLNKFARQELFPTFVLRALI
jgi:hypothetical protein